MCDTTEITVSKYNEGKMINEYSYLSINDSSKVDSILLPDKNNSYYLKFYPNKTIEIYNYEILRNYNSLNPLILIRKE